MKLVNLLERYRIENENAEKRMSLTSYAATILNNRGNPELFIEAFKREISTVSKLENLDLSYWDDEIRRALRFLKKVKVENESQNFGFHLGVIVGLMIYHPLFVFELDYRLLIELFQIIASLGHGLNRYMIQRVGEWVSLMERGKSELSQDKIEFVSKIKHCL